MEIFSSQGLKNLQKLAHGKKARPPKGLFVQTDNFTIYLEVSMTALCKSPEIQQGKIGLQFFICGAKNVVEHYGKRIEILHERCFVGWPNGSRPSHPFWQKSADWLNWPCTIRSALNRTPVQDFNSSSIIFYYIISTTYQKIGDLFCSVHISGLSHSVNYFLWVCWVWPKFLLFQN